MDSSQPSRQEERDQRILDATAASRLLRHAAEIDAVRSVGLTVGELRSAALEAGISPEAFDAALRDLDAGAVLAAKPAPERRSENPPSQWRDVAAIASGVGMGLVVAWVNSWTTNDALYLMPFAITAMLSFELAAGRRRTANLYAFLKEHTLLWLAIAASIAFFDDSIRSELGDIMAGVGLMAVIVGAVGTAIVSARFVKPAPGERMDGDPPNPWPAGTRRGLRDRLRAVASWLGFDDHHSATRAAPLVLGIAVGLSLACIAATAIA